MTSSGTYTYSLPNADILLEAFDRCEIRPTAITAQHMQSARRSINLELQTWSLRGVNLWEVVERTIDLIQGVETYTLPENTVSVLDAYIRTNPTDTDPDNPIDRVITPIGRTEYAALPDKFLQGMPTVFWYNRQITPQLVLWEVPDNNGPYFLHYYAMTQVQDAAATMGQTPDIPIRFYEALCAGVAARLATKYAKAMLAVLGPQAKEAWMEAALDEREKVEISIRPDLSGYWNY